MLPGWFASACAACRERAQGFMYRDTTNISVNAGFFLYTLGEVEYQFREACPSIVFCDEENAEKTMAVCKTVPSVKVRPFTPSFSECGPSLNPTIVARSHRNLSAILFPLPSKPLHLEPLKESSFWVLLGDVRISRKLAQLGRKTLLSAADKQ